MKNFENSVKVLCLLLILICHKYNAQLPQNTNKAMGVNKQGTTYPSWIQSEDWIFSIKSLVGYSDYIAAGYSDTTSGNQYPVVIKFNASGNIIWEQRYSCLFGYAFDIYDVPNGYLVIGEGSRASGCADPPSFFSFLVDKSTGAIDQFYGVKMYNYQTLPFPVGQNGLVQTIVGSLGTGKSRSCEIKNSSGQITGFMICGNYIDNDLPSNTTSLANATNGGFLLKIDINGMPDLSFGTGGLMFYFQNTASKYYQPHLNNVCVNYDSGGNVQGYVVVGSVNETPSSAQFWGDLYNDAFIIMINTAGTITYTDIYDETTHLKNTVTPVSLPYTDVTDITLCRNEVGYPIPQLAQENSNERATRVKQISNGGDFVILSLFDWSVYSFTATPCSVTYPNLTTSFSFAFLSTDPAVFRMNQSGTLVWTKNIYNSQGRDFENNLLVRGSDVFVLGSTNMEPNPGTPTEQQAVVSKLSLSGGTITYERVYEESSNSQAVFCPFAFDFDQSGGIIMAGDNEINNDNYQLINYSPF